MEERLYKLLSFEVITPIFSYGADNKRNSVPEIRPASIKGMMRYMFRIAQPTFESKKLLELENEIFGDPESKASPIRLAVISKPKVDSRPRQFLLHKDDKGEKISIPTGEQFSMRISLRPKHLHDYEKLKKLNNACHNELSWYENLIEVAFLLIGLGQRSRKGRGRARKVKLTPVNQFKGDITTMLNKITIGMDAYKLNGQIIEPVPTLKKRMRRPIIEKVEFGELIERDWEDFLKNVDDASSQMQRKLKKKKFATGTSGSSRFASAIFVGVAEVEEGLLPIYTFVTPVSGNKSEDYVDEKKERDMLVYWIEENEKRIKKEGGDSS